ncbi:Retrovirus-related Pol polyprotein [Collichthys lucidus]|uniref:ribonuclease H n=1 Tax=Collichthys lucidus TaxID=240159 RepID=A0A4U5TV09_COLLU|nr:Retrovirus-related Pol polyprotein [Collichthys lucidus]
MDSIVEEFVQHPSGELLEQCTKEQLIKIAQHFSVEVDPKRTKGNLKSIIKANLQECGVLMDEGGKIVSISGNVLTFEQQKELLLLKLDHEKELEEIKYKKEQMKMDLEIQKLALIKEGKISASALNVQTTGSHFDVASNLRLLPKFNENDVETFCLFERIAHSRSWPDEEQTLMLQCVFTGKAQETYSALSSEDCKDYNVVKSSVLKAYELVPEAYRQRFRSWRKTGKQTHVEFARDLVTHFNRWCSSSGVKTFDKLCDLIALEQFKQSVPDYIATYINEHKVTCPNEAAVLADEYVLTHKRIFGERCSQDRYQKTDTGGCIPVRGMGLTTLFVPIHKMFLSCDLVQGKVEVGVRPKLPVEGVDIILGNDLAGHRLWPDNVEFEGLQLSEVSNQQSETVVASLSSQEVPENEQAVLTACTVETKELSELEPAVTACAVTRSMTAALTDMKQNSCDVKKFALSLPPNLCVSRSELVKEQKADQSLRDVYDLVLPTMQRLYEAGELAKKKLQVSQKKMKKLFDRKVEQRKFSPGLYSYTVMPFGLRNAPATFQRLMNKVVCGLEGCAVYLDDVVVYSESWEEHLHRVKALFDRLLWANLTINLAKCEFAKATGRRWDIALVEGDVTALGLT